MTADPPPPAADTTPEPTWLVWGAVVALVAALLSGQALRASAGLYRELALLLPLGLIGASRAAPHRWGCTIMATLYALVSVVLAIGLASIPQLTPLAFKLSHLVPPALPVLLLAAALGLDLLRRLPPHWHVLKEASALSTLTLVAIAIVRAPLLPCGAFDLQALLLRLLR